MPSEQQVKEFAYQIWEQEGRPLGRHLEHYYRALTTLQQRERERAANGTSVPSLANIGIPSSQIPFLLPAGSPKGKRRGARPGKKPKSQS